MSPVTPPKILLEMTMKTTATTMPAATAKMPARPSSNALKSREMASEIRYKLCLLFIDLMKMDPNPFCIDVPRHAHVTIASLDETSATMRD
jgi:hypothetical protein